MSTHPVLAAHPRWQEHEAKVAELRVREESIRKQVLAASALAEEKRQAHNVAFAKAVSTGGILPSEPPAIPAGFDRALQMLRLEADALRSAGEVVMAEIADDLEAATRDRNRVAMAQVAKERKTLERLRDQVHENLRFVAQVRASVDRANLGAVVRPSRAARTRAGLTFDELLSFAESDSDPLEPEPIPPAVGGRVMIDDGTDESIAVMRRHNAGFTVQHQAATLGLHVQSDTVGAFGARPVEPRQDLRRPGEI
ncbi:MAG: hypothetical protein ACYDDU_07345 [Dermatophilaceae bacterium]